MVVNWKKLSIGGVITVILVIFPLVVKRTDVLNLLFLVFLFITLSQSWNILGGYAGQISLGHAGFFGLGALVTRLLWLSGVPFPVAFLPSGIAALIFALIIGYPAFWLRGPYFIIGMLALAEIMRITIGNVFPMLSAMPPQYVGTYDLAPRYFLGLGLAALTVVVVYAVSNSRCGLAMVAIRENENTAEASGVNTFKYKLLALTLSSFLAGLAGGTFAFYHPSYYPEHPFSVLWTFDTVFITYIGGAGITIGPIIGTLFYIALREVFAITLPLEIHTIVFGILFILVILFMPRGLSEVFGRIRRPLARFTTVRSLR